MKKLFERKENNVIAVLLCIIAVLVVVAFADEKESVVPKTDVVLLEVDETVEGKIDINKVAESKIEIEQMVESVEELAIQETQQAEVVMDSQETVVEDWGSFEQYYMDNPIDNILSKQIEKALVEAEIRDLQELYKELWLEQYQGMMRFVRSYCIYEEELENYERFTGEIERGYEELQPLIENAMLDTFEVPSDSPEKATWGWGNGTVARLAMHEGMYYRNACMLLIPFLNNLEGEYEFITAEEVLERVEELYEFPITFCTELFRTELMIMPDSVDKTIVYDYGDWELGDSVLAVFRNQDNELVIIDCTNDSLVAIYEDWSNYDYTGFEMGLEKGHYANCITVQDDVFGQNALLLQMPVGANAILYMTIVNVEGKATVVFCTTEHGLTVDDADGDGENELISNLEGYFYDWQEERVYVNRAMLLGNVRQLVYTEEYNAWQVWYDDGEMQPGVLKENEYQITLISDEEETRLAFGKALWDVYQKGILPDGGTLYYTGMESARANSFSIIDIDFDGKEELVLRWENACMAGMVEIVYGYEDGVIFEELREFPSMRFYENGIVEVDWSHNQGLAGEFWPYEIYHYDADTDSYQNIGTVDAWDKSLSEKNYEDELFPADIDKDGDGVIYYVLPVAWEWPYDDEYLMDGAEYEAWQKEKIGDASEIEILYQSLTEENIATLGYPKPYVYVPEPKG